MRNSERKHLLAAAPLSRGMPLFQLQTFDRYGWMRFLAEEHKKKDLLSASTSISNLSIDVYRHMFVEQSRYLYTTVSPDPLI